MKRWEYRIETIDDTGKYLISRGYSGTYLGGGCWGDDSIPSKWGKINDLGADGWEMISCQWTDSEAIAVFKRCVEDDAVAQAEAEPAARQEPVA
jgi:hypothetical protein